MGPVQQRHDLEVQRAHSEALGEGAAEVSCGVGRGAAAGLRQVAADPEQLPVDVGALRVCLRGAPRAQVLRMVQVGSCSLQAVDCHLEDAEEVLIAHNGTPCQEPGWAGHRQQQLRVRGQLQGQACWRRWHRCLPVANCQEAAHLRRQGRGLPQVALKAAVIKVHVREGGKGGLDDHGAAGALEGALRATCGSQLAEVEVLKHLQVLQPCQLWRLGADTLDRAALARGRLLALEAQHLRGLQPGHGGHPLQRRPGGPECPGHLGPPARGGTAQCRRGYGRQHALRGGPGPEEEAGEDP
mmetsp:Transcript_88371/g.250432  ORF Transcript_88371/g.250432 Transcript_88371/m.250432 type:complete len:298 (+) Transcript_88371:1083-1976(+)